LIDYFHDLTLLRNGPEDQSEWISTSLIKGINFQKASATLDGCVKIWTSRVDSVATETGKLLSGLAGGGEVYAVKLITGAEVDDDAEDGDDEEGGAARVIRKVAEWLSD
jgi:condensin complex subunit 2